MRGTKLLSIAFAGFVLSAIAVPASATPPAMRTVMIIVSPENAAIAVDGHPRQHANGVLELRGVVGAVFNIEAVASGNAVVQRIVVTDTGALPWKITVPAPPGAGATPASPTLAPDECSPAFWRDAEGIKRYKPQCLALDSYGDPPSSTRPPGLGAMTIVCMPKCDHITLDGREIGPSQVFNRIVVPGRHMLEVSSSNGVRRTVLVDVAADQTKEVRLSMDPSRPAPGDLLSAAIQGEPSGPIAAERSDDRGFLTLASYPWTNVFEGGRSLCLTPCVKIPLEPGVHVLVLDNEGAGVKQSITVTIKGGETTTKHVAFR